jgi:hypothetical protein
VDASRVVNAPIAEVCGADRVTIAACGQRPRQEFIKITPDTGNLFFIEDANVGQVSVAVKSCNLPRRERYGTLCSGRMKPQRFTLPQRFSSPNELVPIVSLRMF